MFPEDVFINQEAGFDKRNNNIKEAIEKDDVYHYIVYEENNSVTGFACYGKARGDDYQEMGEVYSIYIEKENQRRGIGSKMLTKCFELLKSQGYTQAIIRCLRGNQSSNFYMLMGGKVIGSEEGNVGETKIIEDIYIFELI